MLNWLRKRFSTRKKVQPKESISEYVGLITGEPKLKDDNTAFIMQYEQTRRHDQG